MVVQFWKNLARKGLRALRAGERGGFRREQCFDAFNDQGLGMPHKWLKNFQSCCDAEGK